MTEHKHAAVLRAIAEYGVDIVQYFDPINGDWRAPKHVDMNPLGRPELRWRITPKPRTPRRIWVNEYEGGGWSYHTAKESAERCTHRCVARFEFIEVLPDE